MQPHPIKSINPAHPEPARLAEAVALLNEGQPIIVPTETVYGLACRPDIPGAVDRIYQVKGRPESKPLPRMVATTEQVRQSAVYWPEAADRLANAYWPGPLTLIVQTPEGTIGYRIPDHPVMLALLRKVSVPLAVTSANRSGAPDTGSAQDAVHALGDRVPMALDAGPVRLAVPSTVVDVSGSKLCILRKGAIVETEIMQTAAGAH